MAEVELYFLIISMALDFLSKVVKIVENQSCNVIDCFLLAFTNPGLKNWLVLVGRQRIEENSSHTGIDFLCLCQFSGWHWNVNRTTTWTTMTQSTFRTFWIVQVSPKSRWRRSWQLRSWPLSPRCWCFCLCRPLPPPPPWLRRPEGHWVQKRKHTVGIQRSWPPLTRNPAP